jgi:hypothetical protein
LTTLSLRQVDWQAISADEFYKANESAARSIGFVQ